MAKPFKKRHKEPPNMLRCPGCLREVAAPFIQGKFVGEKEFNKEPEKTQFREQTFKTYCAVCGRSFDYRKYTVKEA